MPYFRMHLSRLQEAFLIGFAAMVCAGLWVGWTFEDIYFLVSTSSSLRRNKNMQTPKSRPGPLDVPKKQSPTTPGIARKLKTPGSDSNSGSSPNPINKTPKDRSPKVVDRRSPRILATEKKKQTKMSELEPQVSHLQEELKKAKDQLSSSESQMKKAQHEAEEAKKKLTAMSAEIEETQKQLKEISESEDNRVKELRKLSQERDKTWQSELDALQKQHSMDSTALASAMNEIQNLKIQLDRVYQSEASHAESARAEIQCLRLELSETRALVEKLNEQLNDSREYEARAVEEAGRAQMELEVLKTTEETLRSERANVIESYNSLLLELEQSKNRANSLEELVGKLRENGEYDDETENLKIELNDLKIEAIRLRAALDAAERRYQHEYIQDTVQIRNAYDLVEQSKSESSQKETDLEAKLKESTVEIEELRTKLIEKENSLQSISCENWGLNLKLNKHRPDERETELEIELTKSESSLHDLNARLLYKETQIQSVTEENETLKSEIAKNEIEITKTNNEALEAARNAEREALIQLGFLTEEVYRSSRKVERITEQLDATQASNAEMEAELRRLKVQSDQWRKAAEVAAGMLSSCNNSNGKCVERTGSLDYHTIGRKFSSSFSGDTDDDDSPKKKNGNMLKKIGVLLKKGQK